MSEGVDVLLQGDVLQEGVLQHCLQLLVDLQAELQRHGGVADLTVVQTRHDPRAGSHLSLGKRKLQILKIFVASYLVQFSLLGYKITRLHLHVVGLDDSVLLLNINHELCDMFFK